MSVVKPFEADPSVLAAIRPMTPGDAPVVAGLHAAAMGDSLWGRLGVPFLTALYRALMTHPSFIGFVYEEDGEIRGMIAGSEDVSAMYRGSLLRQGHRLVLPALRGLRRRPDLLRPLASTGAYFRRSAVDPQVDAIHAESLFCSFAPHLRGKRISGHINKVLFDELAWRGHRWVKITTERSNDGAIRQLLSWGFEERGRFSFYGKEMIAYLLDLSTSPRVQPERRHPTSPQAPRPTRG